MTNRARSRTPLQSHIETTCDNGTGRYLVICVGGLQSLVKKMVERHVEICGWKVDAQVFHENQQGGAALVDGVHNGQAGCGKLLLTTDAPPAILKSLRCVQALYALVAHASSLDIVVHDEAPGADDALPGEGPTSVGSRDVEGTAAETPARSEAALTLLESLVSESTMWPAAIDVWRRFRTAGAQDLATVQKSNGSAVGQMGLSQIGEDHGLSNAMGAGVTKLKYRVSVIRDGKHPFKSFEVSPRLGGAVWDANPAWSVDLTGYDVEVVAFILERGVVVGLSLSDDRAKHSSNGRVPKEDKALETGKRFSSLRPSTAYIMLKLADPKPGDVVVDCMCGAGTIPCLGAGWFPDVLFVGGEADESAVDYLKQNRDPRRRLRPPPEATTSGAACAAACAWDAQLLPLRDGTVDAMVVDMPFGVSCGSPKAIGKLYPVALIEMARVLRPGSGRAVLLVAQPYLLGLPEIRRERRKPGGSEAAKGRRRGGACKHYVSSSASPREELRRHENDEHRDAATAAGGGSDFLARGGHEEEQIGSEDFCNQASANVGKDVVAVEKIPSSGAPGALWRVRERHAVNVGGLVSCLVLLDRTNEPSPRPCSDRRRRWVGLHGYCKRRNQQLSTAGVVL